MKLMEAQMMVPQHWPAVYGYNMPQMDPQFDALGEATEEEEPAVPKVCA